MSQLSLGVMGRSSKENEFRLPLHPSHLNHIDPELTRRIYLEQRYAERFGVSDEQLRSSVAGVCPREELIDRCEVIVLPKPSPSDLARFREGQALWGWPHCVQNEALTQIAVDRRLTLIAWEAMHHWMSGGSFTHVFHKNNELAGYCSVLHSLQLTGTTGEYGRRLRAAVISFGATGRGAVTALNALGILDITVLTNRDVWAVASPIHSVRMVHFVRSDDDAGRPMAITSSGPVAVAELLAEHDIVVNCVLQDTDAPLMFVAERELDLFAPGTQIIDVSCDEGMGFSWARPTSFKDPIFTVGNGVHYYAVDHSPSYLWNSATWEISEALLPHVPVVMGGPEAWQSDDTIRRAIEIRDGVIQNPKILSFQRRSAEVPHAKL